MDDSSTEYVFEDGEGYSGSKKNKTISYPQIVLLQLKACIDEGSKEMSGGGIRRRIIKGEVLEFYYPNQREVFINSCEMLKSLIFADIEDGMKKIKPIYEDFVNSYSSYIVEYNQAVEDLEKKYNNQTPVMRSNTQPQYNTQQEKYKSALENIKVNLMKSKLIPVISRLLKNINYYQEQALHI